MYWTDAGSIGDIRRANLDGTGQQVLVTGQNSPAGMALDPVAGQMYWASQFGGAIWRAHLDGTAQQVFLSGLPEPTDIALDVAGGTIYWTDWAGDIRRANLDGSGQLTLVTGQFGASGIALDLEGGQMYWTTDGLGHSIRRANLNGTAQETLVTALSNPLGIALQIGVTPIPEPSTLTLLSIGALGLFAYAGRIKPRFRQGIIQSARSLGRSTPQVLYS